MWAPGALDHGGKPASEAQNGYVSSFFGLIAAPKAELLILGICTAFGAFRVLAHTLVRGPALIWEQEVGGSNPPAPTGNLGLSKVARLRSGLDRRV